MAEKSKMDVLLDQILNLPEAEQAELIETLIDIPAERLGVYHLEE